MTKLKLSSMWDVGTDEERVSLKALEDVDLGDYIVTDTTFNASGTTSNKLRHVYEFEHKIVQKGDLIVLYSKEGKNKSAKTTGANPVPVHFFYWNLKERIWNKTGDRAFLLYAPRDQRQSINVPAVDTKAKS